MLYTSKSGAQCWSVVKDKEGKFPIHFVWGCDVGIVADPRYCEVGICLTSPNFHCRGCMRHIEEVLSFMEGGGILQDRNGCAEIWVRKDQLTKLVRAVRGVLPYDLDMDYRELLGTPAVKVVEVDWEGKAMLEPQDQEVKSWEPEVTDKGEVTLPPKDEDGEERTRHEWWVSDGKDPSDDRLGIGGGHPVTYILPVHAKLQCWKQDEAASESA
jgi:hypothetical protein